MASNKCIETEVAGWKISITQNNFDKFTVVYGMQILSGLTYGQAAFEYGRAVMHALSCEGKIDNRTATEARKAGDRKPVYES